MQKMFIISQQEAEDENKEIQVSESQWGRK